MILICTTLQTFLSTPSVRRATRVLKNALPGKKFLSTPSVRRATLMQQSATASALVFLSTPSVRRATGLCAFYKIDFIYFYPRPPCGGRLSGELAADAESMQISIHALRAEGDAVHAGKSIPWSISIHALRAEGDRRVRFQSGGHCRISIHALRAEGDPGSERA